MSTNSIVCNLSRDIKKMIGVNTSLLTFAIPLVLTGLQGQGVTLPA